MILINISSYQPVKMHQIQLKYWNLKSTNLKSQSKDYFIEKIHFRVICRLRKLKTGRMIQIMEMNPLK